MEGQGGKVLTAVNESSINLSICCFYSRMCGWQGSASDEIIGGFKCC